MMTTEQITTAHRIDDVTQVQYRIRRAMSEATRLIADVDHALANGRLEVADELTSRALTRLHNA